MEKLQVGEMALLENGKEYIVFNTTVLDGVEYIYLFSNFKPAEMKFATQILNGDELSLKLVTDINIKQKLVEQLQTSNVFSK